MNNVDRIFNETLGGHTSTPPVGAWERVEMTLSRRPAANPWRWAAVLVPVVLAAGWMLTRTEPSRIQVATDNTTVSPAPAPLVAVQKETISPEPVAARQKAARPMTVVATSDGLTTETILSSPETAPLEEITIEPVELIAEATEPVPAPAVEKPIVIVITLESVAEAPNADKKALGRVAEFAMAVKHSDPIASLRGVKDELLALDLRKKSTKKN